MAQKPANRVFEEFMRSQMPQQEEPNNKLSAAGVEELNRENDTTTEELSALIKSIGSQTANTEVVTSAEEQNTQTSLQQEANEEYIKKINEERFLAEQEAKKRMEEEQRLAEEAEQAEREKKKKSPLFFLKKKKKDTQTLPDEEKESDETPSPEEEKEEKEEKPVAKKELGIFAKAFAKPKKVVEKESAEENKDEKEIDWQYLATHDEMTETLSQKALDLKGGESPYPFGIVVMDINNLKYINARFGREAGDNVVLRISNCIKDTFLDDEIYRCNGDEFVAVIAGKDNLDIRMDAARNRLEFDLKTMTSSDEDKITYALSSGTYVAAENETIRSAVKKARVEMSKEKEEYHEEHPEFSMTDSRIPDKTEEEKKEEIVSQEDYDELLEPEQKELKKMVISEHDPVSVSKVEDMMKQIQEKLLTESSQIRCLMMTSSTFNDIFIFRDANNFVGMVDSVNCNIDMSYVYIVTQIGGTQYFGPDTYSDKVDELFKAIGNAIRSGTVRTKSDLTKINEINIFQNIYSDFRD